ncbi:MAG TPA: hypothetical protein VLV83_03750 [Acidobacteriota bacterium]|nr:hypothetical protein [Acidobacteriota bacterium]
MLAFLLTASSLAAASECREDTVFEVFRECLADEQSEPLTYGPRLCIFEKARASQLWDAGLDVLERCMPPAQGWTALVRGHFYRFHPDLEDDRKALEIYKLALTRALESQAPLIQVRVLSNLKDVAWSLREWDLVETYVRQAQVLADEGESEEVRGWGALSVLEHLMTLGRIGEAREALEKYDPDMSRVADGRFRFFYLRRKASILEDTGEYFEAAKATRIALSEVNAGEPFWISIADAYIRRQSQWLSQVHPPDWKLQLEELLDLGEQALRHAEEAEDTSRALPLMVWLGSSKSRLGPPHLQRGQQLL